MKRKVLKIIKTRKGDREEPRRTADDFIRGLFELAEGAKEEVGVPKKVNLAKRLKYRFMFFRLVPCQNCNGKGGWTEEVPVFKPRYYSSGGTPEDFYQVGTERRWHPCLSCNGKGKIRESLHRLRMKMKLANLKKKKRCLGR